MRNFIIIIVAVALIGGGILLYAMRGGAPALAPVDLGDLDNTQLVEMAQPATEFGDPDAPVTIMEFLDYQCPTCRQFALMVKPQVEAEYLGTGRAKLVLYDFPLTMLHPHAFLAARAARCAGDQDRYSDYHDLVFRTQEDWSPMSSATGHFKDLAEQLGMDAATFDECLEGDRHAAVVTANMRLGEAFRVTGTPTLVVHDGGPVYRLGGFRFIDIQKALEADGAEN